MDSLTQTAATIEEHTLDVMQRFDKQAELYFPTLSREMELAGFKNVYGLLKATIALHDIGKPLALKKGDSDLQHEFTTPILESSLRKMGYSDREIKLAIALIDRDPIGEIIAKKKGHDYDRSVEEIKQLAKGVGISSSQFYQILRVFYVSDANFYPYVKQFFTEDSAGRLRTKTPWTWEKFEDEFRPWSGLNISQTNHVRDLIRSSKISPDSVEPRYKDYDQKTKTSSGPLVNIMLKFKKQDDYATFLEKVPQADLDGSGKAAQGGYYISLKPRVGSGAGL